MVKKFSSDEERREYNRNHYRVGVKRGRAADRTCACGAPAAEWAHLHDTDGADPANYEAMCRPCHHRYDDRWNPEERAKVADSVKASWDSHHTRDFSEETRAKMRANHRTRGGRRR